ncbi:MAG: carboxypeptidase-like regulatory domain-containing protein [Ginsengibacter sp.]
MKKKIHQRTGKRRLLFIFLLINLIALTTNAQISLEGKVNSKSNEGISGVSVTVRNTTLGTATDANGNYKLSAVLKPGNYIIRFTRVGYKSLERDVTVDNKKNYPIDVVLMNDALGLDEVIVTGTSIGTTRRQLGSYISSVSADELTKGASGNVLQALQGKTAGAQITQNSGDPAGGISVRLRGIS